MNKNVFSALIEGATEIRMFNCWSLWAILRHISYIFGHLIDRPFLPSACLNEGDGHYHTVLGYWLYLIIVTMIDLRPADMWP